MRRATGTRGNTSSRRPRQGGTGTDPQRWRIVLGLFVLALVASAGLHGVLPWPLALWLAGLSLLTLLRYAQDKRAAIAGRQRIPEASLHLLGALGGWPGALVAQGALRHKTAKLPFQTTFWLSVAVNLIAVLATARLLQSLLTTLAAR